MLDPAVGERFLRAINADAARARADANLLLRLVTEGVIVANARELRPHVADLNALDARHAAKQVLPKLGQGVAVGGSQTYSGDDDAGWLHSMGTEIASQPRGESNTSTA